MKFIKSIIFAAIPWYPIGWAIYEITREDELALVGTSIISIIIFFVSMNKLSGNESGTTMASSAIGAVKDIKDGIEFNLEQKAPIYMLKPKKNITTVKLINGYGLKL